MLIVLLCSVLAGALPPGIQSALYGAQMANSDFEIAVQPPAENPLQVVPQEGNVSPLVSCTGMF